MAINLHRGRFDTRFLGVVIRAQSIAELESFRYMDRAAILPADQLAQLGLEAFISEVARLTVLDHELRHFHDALLYPFGAAVLRFQAFGAVNGLPAAHKITRSSKAANVLPIPLQEWLSLPESARGEFLERQSSFAGRQLIPPDLPVVGQDDDLSDLPTGIIDLDGPEGIKAASRIAADAYRYLERLWRAPHHTGEAPIASTAVLWEVPGTLCQLAAIRRASDGASMQRFADWFFEAGPPLYRRGFDILGYLLGEQVDTGRARHYLALTAWSQMGRFETETTESSPMWRIEQLRAARRQGLRWSGDEPFLDLVAIWDDAIDRDSLSDLDDSTAELSLLVDRSAQRAEQVGDNIGGPYSVAATVLHEYYQAHTAMKEAFLREPDTFVDPVTYIDQQSKYPQPTIAVSYMVEHDGETIFDLVDATPPEWRPAIDREVALDFAALVQLTNAVFLPTVETLEPDARYWIRKYFGVEALRFF